MQKSKTKQELHQSATQYMQKGELLQAMKVYYDIHELDPKDIDALKVLVEITRQLKAHDQLIINLQKIIHLEPEKHQHYDLLAAVYAENSDWDSACMTYQALLLNRPQFPTAHYNLAYYLKKKGQFSEAINSYQRALDLGITEQEEVYLNLAVIYADHLRKEDAAEEALVKALTINKNYVPALYNLANIYEDKGNKEKTLKYFQCILKVEPKHVKVLARILQLKKIVSVNDADVLALLASIEGSTVLLGDKVDGYYALGKAYSDCKEYDLSFRYYALANKFNALEMPKYVEENCEKYFDSIIASTENMRYSGSRNDAPVFICGLFRTGSTLIEQILASHPEVTAGGERDFFAKSVSAGIVPLTQSVEDLSSSQFDKLAEEYIKETNELYGNGNLVTDKRPDNFVYLGLIKRVFPRAKIIFTTRDPLDNCLSIYFTRLSSDFDYSVGLKPIAHYYQQHLKLLEHWQSVFQDDLFVLNYDDLINDPELHIRNTLAFLGLEWSDDCLNFYELKNPVKTASVWQVRQPLYSSSSGRWKNYQDNESVKWLIKYFYEGEN